MTAGGSAPLAEGDPVTAQDGHAYTVTVTTDPVLVDVIGQSLTGGGLK